MPPVPTALKQRRKNTQEAIAWHLTDQYAHSCRHLAASQRGREETREMLGAFKKHFKFCLRLSFAELGRKQITFSEYDLHLCCLYEGFWCDRA